MRLGGAWVGPGAGGPGCIPANCVPQPPGAAAGALGLSGTPDPVAATKTLGDPVKPSESQVFLTLRENTGEWFLRPGGRQPPADKGLEYSWCWGGGLRSGPVPPAKPNERFPHLQRPRAYVRHTDT